MISFVVIALLHSPLFFISHLFILKVYKNVETIISLIICLIISSLILCYTLFFIFKFTLDIERVLILSSIQLFFILSYAEFYSMICRVFSLRIMTDIFLQKNVTTENINKAYAMGKGHIWLLNKRIKSIEDLKFVIYKNKKYTLTNKGLWVSKISLIIKKVLNLGKGGE